MDLPSHQLSMTVLMTPDMANFAGNVHGGTILKLLDQVAYACASRYAGRYVVTLSVDQVMFRQPIHVGELVTFLACVNHTGTLVDGDRHQGGDREHPRRRWCGMPTAASSRWWRWTTTRKPTAGAAARRRPRLRKLRRASAGGRAQAVAAGAGAALSGEPSQGQSSVVRRCELLAARLDAVPGSREGPPLETCLYTRVAREREVAIEACAGPPFSSISSVCRLRVSTVSIAS